MDIRQLLERSIADKASDLHVQVGTPPTYRLAGSLCPAEMPDATVEDLDAALGVVADQDAVAELREFGSADFAYSLDGRNRFRVNVFRQRGSLAMVFRTISPEPPPFDSLGLPDVIKEICQIERGLVLVTGATGQGKSTTLAAMIDLINSERRERIITIEDPIEFIYTNKKCLISQRELGTDAKTFPQALRHVLRQDPDIILLGELRDLETVRVAIQAAETGHLVFATLHTMDTQQSVDRMIAYYPPDSQELIRKQLALNLQAVISQRLVRGIEPGTRVPAVEVLRQTPIIQKLLLADKVRELQQAVQNRESNMQTFDQSLVDLCKRKKITKEEGIAASTNPNTFKRILSGGVSGGDQSSLVSF